jgi:hypothetical protein
MRQFLILPAALLFGGGTPSSPPSDEDAFVWREVGQSRVPTSPKFTIRSGPVANAEATAVWGTFQVLKTGAPSGIPSAGLAGACLIFPATDLGFEQMAAKQCHRDADCSTPGENVAGTCDIETNRCWSKPEGLAAATALCNRGIIAFESELNPVPSQPVDVLQLGIERGAKVRVGTCLNKSGINPLLTGCLATDGPDRIFDLGPVATIR